MIDQLKDLKDIYENVRQQIDRGKEPLEELMKLSNFLNALNQDPSILKTKVDQDYKRYFYEDFSIGILKRLAKERSKNDKYLETVAGIEESFVKLAVEELREGNFNQQFFDSIKMVFEYDCILHNYNYQISDEELKSLRNTNQPWRQELKEGDMVDAIVDENQNNRCSGWSQARISYINQDSLHLEFIYDSKNADRSVDRWSVEIAPFQSKTQESWEWRSTLAPDTTVDAHDKTVWNKSTILDIKEQQAAADRTIKLAYIAYRVYVEGANKSDERGTFEGWSNRFDEWIPLYSPRLQPFHSKTQKGLSDDIDIDEEMDSQIKPQEGQDRVYAVPRIRKCTSSLYIQLINLFGNLKGFDLIIENLEKQDDEKLDLNILSALMTIVSAPYLVFHKDFIHEYGMKLVELCKKRLKEAPEKNLRDVRREKIEGIIKSIDLIQRRCLNKDDREKQTEILKLEVSMMCLRSNYLERRIQGVKDLNQIIKNNRMFSHRSFTSQYLIEWMTNNEVFTILFDPKQTHLQLVQRCGDILKLLLQEDKFDKNLMEMFWNLAKSDYKFEVYKIINECSFYLKQSHIDFFFEQIKQVPAEKLAMEEFQCLSELGKYAREEQFKVKVSDFFWQVICNADSYKEDLVSNCITKFCEMVKNWELEKKQDFFIHLVENLKSNKASLPTIRLFKGLMKDQKEKFVPSMSSGNYQDQQSSQVDQQELTLNTVLDNLLNKNKMVQVFLDNLTNYCIQVNEKFNNKPYESRKKLFIVHPKYSHHDEIDERLQFLKYIAQISDFKISKVELGVIYELLVIKSKITSDQEEFLTWCKSSCEQSSAITHILDLNEVGEFFTEKMQSKELDLKNLLVVGFDFLQQYFLTVNEKENKLIKSQKTQKTKYQSISYNYQMGSYGYGPSYNRNYYKGYGNKSDEGEDTGPIFKILVEPEKLDKLDIVWNIALEVENSKVVSKAIDFLIKVYSCLDEDLTQKKIDIQDALIEKCMNIIKESNQSEFRIKRSLEIIKNIIYEAEKKGTGDVQPHNALLKGELLERLVVKNKASPKRGNFVLSVYSNVTVWELKKEVAKLLDLSPKYLRLQRSGGNTIQDIENGKTLAQLGIENHESISAIKVNIEEEVANAPLIGSDGKLTDKAKSIFNEWFDMYSDENGQMVKETCAQFIKGCTGEVPSVNDDRITSLFKTYDGNNDGKIERFEFLHFYETASRNKPDTVRENLRAHNIRNDLKKLSEIQEESSFTNFQMPRYKISKNQDYFDLLVSLLDRHDQSSETSWDLIQMLATNETLYKRVLELQTAKDGQSNQIDWSKFFDQQSLHKLLYTLQIIEAVMEEGEDVGNQRIKVLSDEEKVYVNKNVPKPPPLNRNNVIPQPPGINQEVSEDDKDTTADEKPEVPKPMAVKKPSTIVQDQVEDEQLKNQWTKMFLDNNGFNYILSVFMQKDIQTYSQASSFKDAFELKHIAFLLKLLRIFIMAAFSTSNESSVYQEVTLIRRSSMQEDEPSTSNDQKSKPTDHEGSRFKELQKLLRGPMGKTIIDQINYAELQQKILQIIAQILSKQKMIFEDKLIIENALSLWVGCILHMNHLWNDFLNFKSKGGEESVKSAHDFILTGLLYCNQDKIREEFRVSLSSLSNKLQVGSSSVENPPLFYLLNLLSENFALISKYQCKQYFELFCELIDHFFVLQKGGEIEQADKAFNPEKLLSLIIDKIKEYNQLAQENQDEQQQQKSDEELEQEQTEQENIYIGLLQLTEKIIDNFDISFSEKVVQSKNLIDEIFINFLFSSIFAQEKQNSMENLRIKPKKGERKSNKKVSFGKRSKDSAYKLLNSLISKSPNLLNQFLENSMIPLIKLIKRHDGWNYSPPGSTERTQKYVGLRNLGCICYMNAMMQQFFMIPSFRYNLLCVDDQTPEDIQEYKGQKIDDNVLHQLQKLMAHLELSERSDYNPFEFCFAYKDLDGNPTNTSEQKDAQEFLNLAFDRIENLLQQTQRKYLLQSVFGGKTCSQIVCKECGKVSNRIEDYYNLSLTVKDIKSMHDSLSKLVEGEQIDGYECEDCKKKVEISKRTLISSTPNVLIVHLQRIIFNFDTFRNDKINSYFEFPYQLDLTPYSFYEVMKKEGRLKKKKGEDDDYEDEEEEKKEEEGDKWPEEEDCFEYKLVGVVVHSGTANAGHYWSYINTRRGYNEPDEKDNNWSKTESDPWMEFNDSSVREFNFEKLKDECFGGDGRGNDDAWSFGGSYGKSAYMLVYERRTKKPLKILVDPEESKKPQTHKVYHDENKDEYYKLIDFREGVEDIAPNKIYKQVFEDNQKFEFENDIYSQEFFEFVKRILGATLQIDSQKSSNTESIKKARANSLLIGRKVTFEILCKCFHNQSIKEIVQAIVQILSTDVSQTQAFLQACFDEDDCNYLLELLLECSDSLARQHMLVLMKFVINQLKLIEKDYLYEMEKITKKDDKGVEYTEERPKALTARFILKCFSLLNTQVAKNWSKFEHFLELLASMALSEKENSEDPEEQKVIEQQEKIGLEFYYKHKFIEKACDFLLGRKSPLCQPSEKRYEMGGSFSSPNFSSIIKLMTRMIRDKEMIGKYPLTEVEQSMFLHNDLLKIMLGSPQGSKEFGQCLANMCKDNLKLSKRVSKVFLKVINNSNFDNVKNYLKALKPFVKLNDSLKLQKLEWIFGIGQIIAKKGYKEDKFKYGLEHVDKINEECYQYLSPLLNSSSEESLLTQLIKFKGKLDTLAVNCLKEMTSLMAKDDDIARFIYRQPPPTYQFARYTDWFRPYLESQKAEIERSNSYSYFKSKHDTILASLRLFTLFEEKAEKMQKEDDELMQKMLSEGGFKGLQNDWLGYRHADVMNHFPPQLIIGKQVEEEKVILEEEDELVKVTLSEITCEYNYSNPTRLFNLSLPHIDLRQSNYSTMSYQQFKNAVAERERMEQKQKEQASKDNQQEDNEEEEEDEQPPQEAYNGDQQEQEPINVEIETKNWFTEKKTGPVILKVSAQNKSQSKISFRVYLSGGKDTNVTLPTSFIKEVFFGSDQRTLMHFIKIDPTRSWGELKVKIESTQQNIRKPPQSPQKLNFQMNTNHYIPCPNSEVCHQMVDPTQDYCEGCGGSVKTPPNDPQMMEQYFNNND